MRAPLGEGPNVSNRAGNQESEWCSGSRGILGLRPGVGSAIRFLGRLTATRVRHGEGPTETGRAILVRTVPGSLSGRATPRVPSLSNSRSRCSQDLNKGRAGPQGCGPEFEDLAPSLPSPPREHNPSCTPPERSGEEGRNRPLFPTKEQEIVGPSRWVCPGSDSLRKLSLEPEPHGQGSRAGLSRTGQSSAPVGGWMQ